MYNTFIYLQTGFRYPPFVVDTIRGRLLVCFGNIVSLFVCGEKSLHQSTIPLVSFTFKRYFYFFLF